MFLDARFGEPQWHLSRPKDYFMRVPHQVLDCIVFVGRTLAKGSVSEPVVTGTGFLISVPGTIRQCNHTYLVTARHVAEPLTWGEWFIRVNTKDGVRDVRISEGRWWKHPAEPDAVDAAAIPVSLEGWDHIALASSMLLTDALIEEAYIGPGDEVFTMGLFHKVRGRERILPVVRIGNIAMMPPERVTVKILENYYESEVYLTESRSIDGLSGSPVIARFTAGVEWDVGRPGGVRRKTDIFVTGGFFLLGLMHGQWNIRESDHNQVSFQTVPGKSDRESIAVGIAVVVPAKKILDILNQEALVRERLQKEQAMNAAEGSTATD